MWYFEFKNEKSKKFWQVQHSGLELWVTWGKIGTKGQSQIKNFDDEHKASLAKDKLIADKLKKGYVESVTVVETKNESIATHELKESQSMATKTNQLVNESKIELPNASIQVTSSEPVPPNPTPLTEIDNKPLSSPPWLLGTNLINIPKALIDKSFAHRNRPWKNKNLDIQASWEGYRR
ncbi:WGR domain-containing protein [Thorsellia anophelis]|uniref:WGR domain-containing protein, predicted DNA-binding domain in MolR n=1 Tax=Thorsellia anophelis DSM 18579 TaxID=1123402 RepID=A0A1I0C9W1_9GAMM|nr:WGR domain-containing protein [Thorsellia anophelis]SET16211.1 WGR domain-containing protein, predicted DNA-binding domain in MolR [Thorsellia anophelis DSM 18579]